MVGVLEMWSEDQSSMLVDMAELANSDDGTESIVDDLEVKARGRLLEVGINQFLCDRLSTDAEDMNEEDNDDDEEEDDDNDAVGKFPPSSLSTSGRKEDPALSSPPTPAATSGSKVAGLSSKASAFSIEALIGRKRCGSSSSTQLPHPHHHHQALEHDLQGLPRACISSQSIVADGNEVATPGECDQDSNPSVTAYTSPATSPHPPTRTPTGEFTAI